MSQSPLFSLHTEYANLLRLCFPATCWCEFLFLLVCIVPYARVNGIQISKQREILFFFFLHLCVNKNLSLSLQDTVLHSLISLLCQLCQFLKGPKKKKKEKRKVS